MSYPNEKGQSARGSERALVLMDWPADVIVAINLRAVI